MAQGKLLGEAHLSSDIRIHVLRRFDFTDYITSDSRDFWHPRVVLE